MKIGSLITLAILTLSLFLVINGASRTIAVSNYIVDHAMAKGVEDYPPYDPIVRTTTFLTTDSMAYSWVDLANVSPNLVVSWDWISLQGPYSAWDTTIPNSDTGNVWGTYTVYSRIQIYDAPAEYDMGNWQVQISLNGSLAATDSFSLTNPSWGVIANQTTGPGYPAGVSVDPATNIVYTINSGDTETLTINGQSLTTYCIRMFNGTTGTPLGVYPIMHSGSNLGPNLYPLFWPTGILAANVPGGDPNATLVYIWGLQLWEFAPSTGTFSPLDMGPAEGGASNVAVDTNTGHIFIAHEGENQSVITALGSIPCTLSSDASWFTSPCVGCLINLGSNYFGDDLAVNLATSMVYAVGNRTIFAINESTYAVSQIPLSASLPSGYTQIAVNPATNMIYVHTRNLVFDVLEVINGTDNSIVATLTDNYNGIGDGAIAVNPATNRIYINDWATNPSGITIIDGYTNTAVGRLITSLVTDGGPLVVNPTTGNVYVAEPNSLADMSVAGTLLFLSDGSGSKGVVINEVQPNPEGFANWNGTQWVELYNSGTAGVCIGNWTLTPYHGGLYSQSYYSGLSASTFTDGLAATIPLGTTIPAGGYYLYETRGQYGDSWLSPSNDTVLLRNAQGRIVDWTPFLSSPVWNGSGETWQRMPNGQDTPAIGDWSFLLSTCGSSNGARFNAGAWNNRTYYVDIVSNSTITDLNFNFNAKTLTFNVTGTSGTMGFYRVDIPLSLMCANLGEWIVTVNGTQLSPPNLNITTDANYTYVYFTYHHSTEIVRITSTSAVPEFQPLMLLPLFVIITLLGAIAVKRKRTDRSGLPILWRWKRPGKTHYYRNFGARTCRDF
jgi:hypothetical protein